jgi:hypothetical protein
MEGSKIMAAFLRTIQSTYIRTTSIIKNLFFIKPSGTNSNYLDLWLLALSFAKTAIVSVVDK